MAAPLVVVLHGPNLAALGWREPAVYGTMTLAEVDAAIVEAAGELGLAVRIDQSNHEGALVDAVLDARGAFGVVLNAGAYAHTSLALADAVRAIAPVPVVEVHLTNTAARADDPLRARSVVGAACRGRIEGFGANSYVLALHALQAGRH